MNHLKQLTQFMAPWRHLSSPALVAGQGKTTTPMGNLVDLRQVYKIYETPAGAFSALKGVDLQVGAGEFVAVIGKSGSGKSTLINMISGIDDATLGEIYVAGAPIHQMNRRQVARWRGLNLGIIFQFFQLFPTLTLIEKVMMPMEFCGLYGSLAERYERAMTLLELVELADQATKMPAMVSGGQQQRAAIARALANDPALLIADEPTGSLDAKTADTIFKLFNDLLAQGKTILMVTHDQDLASRVSRVIVIADGQLINRPVMQALPQLDNRMLIEISNRLTPVTFPPHTTIFAEGEPSELFYIVVKGEVELIKTSESGTALKLATIGTGQYLGEMMLTAEERRTATARSCAQEVVLMSIDRTTYAELLQEVHLPQDAIAELMRQRVTTGHLLDVLPAQPLPGKASLVYERLAFQPGEVIIQQGDLADKFFLITKGAVEILHPSGDPQYTKRFTSGQYFGEIGLEQPDSRRTRTVQAAADLDEEIELIALGRDLFRQFKQENKMLEDEIALTVHRYLTLDQELARANLQ